MSLEDRRATLLAPPLECILPIFSLYRWYASHALYTSTKLNPLSS